MQPASRHDMAHTVAALQIADHHNIRPHQRQESGSTVASTVLESPYDSPYPQYNPNPVILGTDFSPATHYGLDDTTAQTTRPAGPFNFAHGYMSVKPVGSTYISAMKDMALGQDTMAAPPSARRHQHRNSMPSRSTTTDDGDKLFKIPSNEYRQVGSSPRVELFRTESAACQDELYNPADFSNHNSAQTHSSPSTTNAALLSPPRNLVTEIVKSANDARTQSPAQTHPGRNRSPFRRGSPLAPQEEFHRASVPILNTAAAVRIRQKAQNAAREYAQHVPQLRREPTETISPRDAMLDYIDSDQDPDMPLFSDVLPDAYQRLTAADSLQNAMYSQFMPNKQPSLSNFRAADGSAVPPTSMPQQQLPQSQQRSHHPRAHQRSVSLQHNSTLPQNFDVAPTFPVSLTSMESSISENAPPSSQEMHPAKRFKQDAIEARPFRCTSESCTTRFESARALHEHRSLAHSNPTAIAATSPTLSSAAHPSPRTAASDDSHDDASDNAASLSSSALLARNSQAGPHKCTRINPSTGKPCNTIFSRPYDLTRHEDTIHNRVKHKVACEYCTELKTFSRNDALTRHMRVVHPEIEHNSKRFKPY